MRAYRRLLISGAVAVVAAVGLAACNGGDGGMSLTTNSPQPQPQQPDQPTSPSVGTLSFDGYVHSQFGDGIRNSNTATPAKVGSMKFKFDHKNDPHAFDDLFGSSSGNGG